MKKEILIKKWLDNDLTADELMEFQQLDEYDSYIKLSNQAQFFKAPDFDSSEAYKKLQPIIEKKRTQKTILQRFRPIAQIAAIFIIGFISYTLFISNDLTTIETLASQKTTVTLPDASTAQLNSFSELSYDEDSWKQQRAINLDGEAYFKVAKGSQFDVQTSSGVVSVLGTQFNVKNRNNYFEVKCFEGKVSVMHNGKLTILPAGNTLRIVNGIETNNITDLEYPTWIEDKSTFKSVPLSEVIAEMERQYDVNITTTIDTAVLFSGTFVHNNKDLALQSITIPFSLEYSIENNLITLTKVD